MKKFFFLSFASILQRSKKVENERGGEGGLADKVKQSNPFLPSFSYSLLLFALLTSFVEEEKKQVCTVQFVLAMLCYA